MATFKPIVKHKRKDGTYKVYIRVTHNSKLAYIPTNIYIVATDMTRSLNIKSKGVLDRTSDIILRYRKKVSYMGEYADTLDIDSLVMELTKKEDAFYLDFVDYAIKYADSIMSTSKGTADNIKIAFRNFEGYFGRIDINSLTKGNIQRYVDTLEGNRKPSLYFGIIRAAYNRARKEFNDEDAGIIRIPRYPFAGITLPKERPTKKRALPEDQILRISRLKDVVYEHRRKDEYVRFNIARDVFMMSFILVGMNTVDMYLCNNSEGGRLTYNRKKTESRREDEALISIKIEPEALEYFEKYKGRRSVFSFAEHYSSPSTFNSNVNKGLKKVGNAVGIEGLTLYSARHSWATIANSIGIDKYTIYNALNHSDGKMKVTDIYIKEDWGKIDRANRAVLDYTFLVKPTLDMIEYVLDIFLEIRIMGEIE